MFLEDNLITLKYKWLISSVNSSLYFFFIAEVDLMYHIHGSRHQNNVQDFKGVRKCLSSYHKHFSQLPPNFQAHLIHFHPGSIMTTVCQLCGQKVHYDDLKIHILTQNHRSALHSRMEQSKIANVDLLLDKACRVYSNDEHPIASTSNSDTLQYADDDRPAQFKFNFPPPPTYTTFYDQSILNVCYPNHITSIFCQIDDNPMYTIQFKGETDAYCLLCKCHVEGRLPPIKIHLNGTRHHNNATNGELLHSLEAYHSALTQLTPELQTHVIYFTPASLTKVECLLCAVTVQCDSLEAHIFNHSHMTALNKRYCGGMSEKKETLIKRALELYGNYKQLENGEKSDQALNGIVKTGRRRTLNVNVT